MNDPATPDTGNPQGVNETVDMGACEFQPDDAPPPREACCFIDGTCEDFDPGTCIDLGGGNQGAETTCAGGGCEGSACPTGASGDCCEAMCSIDPFCCDVAWDTLCAAQAQELCPICGGP